jgi:hypothetical protein
MDVIRDRLMKDTTLGKRTDLTVEDIMTLLDFVLATTYFQFDGEVYKEVFGAPMGSPVSVAVSDLYMEDLEERAMDTAPPETRPKIWKRYIDDSFEIVKRAQRENLTDHLNKMDATGSIKFTDEPETEGSIPFLDALISRTQDGSMKVQVYRKKTHTDQYLNFESHHPLQHKLGVIRTLYDRSDNIVTDPSDASDEIDHVNKALNKCGYPTWAFKKVRRQIDQRANKTTPDKKTKDRTDTHESRVMVTIPYVKGVSEALGRVFRRHGGPRPCVHT